MKAEAIIRSHKFPSYHTPEEGINYNCGENSVYGKRLAEYLSQSLKNENYVILDMYSEDWGWAIEIDHDGHFLLFVGCSNDSPESEGYYRIFVFPDQPIIWRWFRMMNVENKVAPLLETLDKILKHDPDIEFIQWQ